MLIDSGATHNFISDRLMMKLGIEAEATASYGVLVAGGVRVKGKGMVMGEPLQLQGCTVETTYLPLELGLADVIMGIQWLNTLGETRFNWKLQWMKLMEAGKLVKLHGDPSLHTVAVSLKVIWKAIEQDGEGVLVEFGGIQKEELEGGEEEKEVWKGVLGKYAEVFEEPTGLPPSRGKEHAINLKEDSNPVSVRPFRYPQAQKAEKEKQIASMLAAGIIQENNSPFSSPVLLVK